MDMNKIQEAGLQALKPVIEPFIKGFSKAGEPPKNPIAVHVGLVIDGLTIPEDEMNIKALIKVLIVDYANTDPEGVKSFIAALGDYPRS